MIGMQIRYLNMGNTVLWVFCSLFKASWKWGPNGHGAILLVNCDSESNYALKELDNEDNEITKVSGEQVQM